MNKMDEVCNMFGLKLFDKFNIIANDYSSISHKIRNPYFFTDEGLISNFFVLDNNLLPDLIIGSLKIEKLP